MFAQSFLPSQFQNTGWKLFDNANKNRVCREVSRYCQSGWPKRKTLPIELKPFHQVSSDLMLEDRLLMRQHQIVIPEKQILAAIHSGHQGIHKCRERASSCVWWPRMSRDLEELVYSCEICKKTRNQRPEPLISSLLLGKRLEQTCFSGKTTPT